VSKLPLVLHELHRTETGLGRLLLAVADRHHTDHEVVHVAHDVARWPRAHVRRLAEVAAGYGVRLDADPRWSAPAPLAALVRRGSDALGRRPEPGLLLLADLRRVYRKAAGVSLDWELLAQAAQAMRLQPLVELATVGHPQTLRIMRWADAQLKVSAPQVIAG
jgi:hypothetical protein